MCGWGMWNVGLVGRGRSWTRAWLEWEILATGILSNLIYMHPIPRPHHSPHNTLWLSQHYMYLPIYVAAICPWILSTQQESSPTSEKSKVLGTSQSRRVSRVLVLPKELSLADHFQKSKLSRDKYFLEVAVKH